MLRLRSAQAPARGDQSGRAESRPFNSQNKEFNVKKPLLERKRIFSLIFNVFFHTYAFDPYICLLFALMGNTKQSLYMFRCVNLRYARDENIH
jgi:hypothetical protein